MPTVTEEIEKHLRSPIAARLTAEPGWRAGFLTTNDEPKIVVSAVVEWVMLGYKVSPPPPDPMKQLAWTKALEVIGDQTSIDYNKLSTDELQTLRKQIDEVEENQEVEQLVKKSMSAVPSLWPCVEVGGQSVSLMSLKDIRLLGCFPPTDERTDDEIGAWLKSWFDDLSKAAEGEPKTAWDHIRNA